MYRQFYVISMLEEYQGESLGLSEAGGQNVRVTYGADVTRYIVTVEGGLLKDAQGRPLSGSGIFVLSRDGQLIFTALATVGRVHHSSLAQGRAVAAAGELTLVDGRIMEINNHSGHYRPPAWLNRQVIEYLRSQGVEISESAVHFK